MPDSESETEHTLEIVSDIDIESESEDVVVPVSPIVVKKKKGFLKDGVTPRKKMIASEARCAALKKGREVRQSNLQKRKDEAIKTQLKQEMKQEILQEMAIAEYKEVRLKS